MTLATLEINELRNLQHVLLHCSPKLNLISGANASGKTSVLEAIYLLSLGRSFRTRNSQDLIRHGQTACRVVVQCHDANGKPVPIGIERTAQGQTARINGVPAQSLAELASALPALLLNPDSHRLLDDGPQQRRKFMDWGVFQGEQAFLPTWRRYRTALKNRNAALRNRADDRGLLIWEKELNAAASTLDQLRQAYCEALEAMLSPFLEMILGEVEPKLEYRRGWAQGQSLLDLLQRDREQDRQYGYTRLGPQRADFKINIKNQSINESLSRGQQKLLVIALVLAQAELYLDQCGRPCLLLIDDLPAELDRQHRERVMACLMQQASQLFITAIEPEMLISATWRSENHGHFRLSDGRVVV